MREAPSGARIFSDWTAGARDQMQAIDRVIEGILFDVEHNRVWFDTSRGRPGTAVARRRHIEILAAEAALRIRVYGHRFLPTGTGLSPVPVLSIHQSDTIV